MLRPPAISNINAHSQKLALAAQTMRVNRRIEFKAARGAEAWLQLCPAAEQILRHAFRR